MNHLRLALCVLGLHLLCGCYPPAAPEAVSARLPGHVAIYGDTQGTGDTVIIGRCVASEEYAATPRGDWVDHWYFVRVQGIWTEQGRWGNHVGEDARDGSGRMPATLGLTFIAVDAWPKPGSGIIVSKLPWPYRSGLVYAFTLDTSASPALIVGQERRSLVDPRSCPAAVAFPPETDEAQELVSRIHSAVASSRAETEGAARLGGIEIVEETDAAYIVIARLGAAVEVLAVSKRDFSVTAVEQRQAPSRPPS